MQVATRQPYAAWVESETVRLADLPEPPAPRAADGAAAAAASSCSATRRRT